MCSCSCPVAVQVYTPLVSCLSSRHASAIELVAASCGIELPPALPPDPPWSACCTVSSPAAPACAGAHRLATPVPIHDAETNAAANKPVTASGLGGTSSSSGASLQGLADNNASSCIVVKAAAADNPAQNGTAGAPQRGTVGTLPLLA